MGEIADSLINGECDYITGEYIGPPVGYPRSFYADTKPNRKGKDSVWGVIKYLLIGGISDPVEQYALIDNYCPQYKDIKQQCNYIQKDFTSFTKFVKNAKDNRK